MFFRTVFSFAVVVVLVPLVVGTPWQRSQRMQRSPSTFIPEGTITIIQLESPCAMQGGMCLRTEDCPPENIVKIQADLCPAQRHLGVECCYN